MLTKKVSLWKKFNSFTHIFTGFLETIFYRLGVLVGRKPWYTIVGSILLCLVCSAGMFLWKENRDDVFLWTPYGSAFIDQRKWIEDNFPKDTRYETHLISGENVLTADCIRYLHKVDQRVNSIQSKTYNNTFENLCIRDLTTKRCSAPSVLRLWDGHEADINTLKDEDVIETIDAVVNPSSPGYKPAFLSLLSGMRFNQTTGNLVGAKAILSTWLVRQANGTVDSAGETVDLVAKDWEAEFVEQIITNKVPGKPQQFKDFAIAERSYDDGIDNAVNSNLQMLFVGFGLIFIYIATVLGRWNPIEQRVFISAMGILVIGLSLGASFGLCFYMQIFYADMHPIIPFLLLGIGVDDMFVVVQALDNLGPEAKKMDLPERMGQTMKHAGVSITVTSVTDMAAFLIGSSTSMPILRAFCVFAAMGVLFLFIFVITFFAGCLALDEQRQDVKKVINFPCFKSKPESWKPNNLSQKNLGKHFFKNYLGKFILKTPVSIICVLLTFLAFGFGIYGVTQIETNYDSIWYMDQNSYQTDFYSAMDKFFPQNGERVEVYIGDIKYWEFKDQLIEIEKGLVTSQYVQNNSVLFWFPKFYQEKCLATAECGDENFFKESLNLFLCDPSGDNQGFFEDIKISLSPEEICNKTHETNYTIIASRAKYQHGKLKDTQVKNTAMNEIKDKMKAIIFEGESFKSPIAYAFMYIQWEANIVISTELIRNLSLTFATITVVTLILVANIQTCAIVLLSVVFSVTNVCGYAYFMGLTIEIVTSIILILSVGLALDYSAHIAVHFVCIKDNNRERMTKSTLALMGPPVFHGGFSTFVAFLLLAWSESYVFKTFFKLFGMVVLFGLYHGLVFVPILLNLMGPVHHTHQDPVIEETLDPTSTQIKAKTRF